MIPLALTSTAGWIRRLGGRNWQRLHRLIYLTGIAGVTHYWWRVKADTLHPAIYAAIVAVLLGYRLALSIRAIAMVSVQPVQAARHEPRTTRPSTCPHPTSAAAFPKRLARHTCAQRMAPSASREVDPPHLGARPVGVVSRR